MSIQPCAAEVEVVARLEGERRRLAHPAQLDGVLVGEPVGRGRSAGGFGTRVEQLLRGALGASRARSSSCWSSALTRLQLLELLRRRLALELRRCARSSSTRGVRARARRASASISSSNALARRPCARARRGSVGLVAGRADVDHRRESRKCLDHLRDALLRRPSGQTRSAIARARAGARSRPRPRSPPTRAARRRSRRRRRRRVRSRVKPRCSATNCEARRPSSRPGSRTRGSSGSDFEM